MFGYGKVSVFLLQHRNELSPNFIEFLKNANRSIVCGGFIGVSFLDQLRKHVRIPVDVLFYGFGLQSSDGLVQFYCLSRLYVHVELLFYCLHAI